VGLQDCAPKAADPRAVQTQASKSAASRAKGLQTCTGCKPRRVDLQHHAIGQQDPTLLEPSWVWLATRPNILGPSYAAIPKNIGSEIFVFFFDLNLFFI